MAQNAAAALFAALMLCSGGGARASQAEEAVPVENAVSVPAPDPGGLLISFSASLFELPPPGEIVLLAANFDEKEPPYAGWGFGFRHFETSVLPVMYWRTTNGEGGWNTFPFFPLETKKKYCITLLAKEREPVTVFLQAKGSEVVQSLGKVALGSLDIAGKKEKLRLGSTGSAKYNFQGQVQDVLVARLKQAPPTEEEALYLVKGCSTAIGQRLQRDEVVIKEPGTDTEGTAEAASVVIP